MDGTAVSFRLGGFTPKKESFFERFRKHFVCAHCVDRYIAIGAAEKRIGLPIMEVGRLRPVYLPVEHLL